MKISGIYRISVIRPNQSPLFYIGQSVDIGRRKIDHINALRRGDSKNLKLQRAYDKYSENSFIFDVVAVCPRDKDALAVCEIEEFKKQISISGAESLLNICVEKMTSVLGIKRSIATRKLQSDIAKNRAPMPEETRSKISETKRARGQKPNAEHMEKLKALAKGKARSEETKRAIAKSLIGRKKPAEEIARRQATRYA